MVSAADIICSGHGQVFEPQEIVNTEYDYIFICVFYYGKQIYETCKQVGIILDKLIFTWTNLRSHIIMDYGSTATSEN